MKPHNWPAALFQERDVPSIVSWAFNGFAVANIFFALLAAGGLFTGAGIQNVACGWVFFGLMIGCSRWPAFQQNPLSLLFCLYALLFLSFPLAIVLVSGASWRFGEGLPQAISQAPLQAHLPGGILFLTLCCAVTAISFALIRFPSRAVPLGMIKRFRAWAVLLVVLLVVVLSSIKSGMFKDARAASEAPRETLLNYLFFDHACWLLLGSWLLYRLNAAVSERERLQVRNWLAIAFILFTVQHTLHGSKAAILSISILFLAYTFVAFRQHHDGRAFFFSRPALILLAILALPLFYVGMVYRISLSAYADELQRNFWVSLVSVRCNSSA